MKHLQKTWLRILLSIISGAILAEVILFKTGNSSLQVGQTIVFFSSILVFSFLTLIVWVYNRFFLPRKEKDILDDF